MIRITTVTYFRRLAKLAYVSAKNFYPGRGSVVLPRIYPFVRSASQPGPGPASHRTRPLLRAPLF
jgi:hypothetical protein